MQLVAKGCTMAHWVSFLLQWRFGSAVFFSLYACWILLKKKASFIMNALERWEVFVAAVELLQNSMSMFGQFSLEARKIHPQTATHSTKYNNLFFYTMLKCFKLKLSLKETVIVLQFRSYFCSFFMTSLLILPKLSSVSIKIWSKPFILNGKWIWMLKFLPVGNILCSFINKKWLK